MVPRARLVRPSPDELENGFLRSRPKTPATAPANCACLKDENEQLKRECVRKEKALAEAAALLILQKKFRALWEDEDK